MRTEHEPRPPALAGAHAEVIEPAGGLAGDRAPALNRRELARRGLGALATWLAPVWLLPAQAARSLPAGPAAGDPGPALWPLWQLDAVAIAALVRQRRVSCMDVVEAHLERIGAVNGGVNAVTQVLADQARHDAEQADLALARGSRVGALHGVPMTVKGNVDLAGSATTEGVAVLRDNLAAVDSPHVAQLRRAGAIPIARTNLPDLGLRWHTDSGLHGATRNPWQAALTPGGSSGGDAAAVATGMAPLGLGNDYGGSLRWPAQCCGVATIRPSLGRVPFHTMGHDQHPPPLTMQLFAVQGPIARSVRDLRLALQAMSGADARDPRWVPAPLRGTGGGQRWRVGLTVDPGAGGVDTDVADGVGRAGQALAAAGHRVEAVDPPAVNEAAQIWRQLVAAELRGAVAEVVASIAAPDAVAFLRRFLALHPALGLDAYAHGWARRHALRAQWSSMFERFDLIVGPVSTRPPFRVGTDLAGDDEVLAMLASMRLVLAVSLLGLPAVVVPVGLARGVPQAVQIVAPMFREDLGLDAAAVIESALGSLAPIDPLRSLAPIDPLRSLAPIDPLGSLAPTDPRGSLAPIDPKT